MHEGSNIKVSTVHLPAVNTPQFDWARAHITNTPRPMGRPTQPEIVGDAVFRAAAGSRREYWLGGSTLLTILGNAVLPGFLDRYLARKAIAGQQTSVPVSPLRPDNLDDPVRGLHRTRGSYSAESKTRAIVVVAEAARVGAVASLGISMFALGVAVGRSRRKSGRA